MVNMRNLTLKQYFISFFYHTFSLKSIEQPYNLLNFAALIKKEVMSTERKVSAFLEITMKVNESDRAAAQVCTQSIVSPFWIQLQVR